MQAESMVDLLGNDKSLEAWLTDAGIKDFARAKSNLLEITESGITIDQLDSICLQLAEHLSSISDPDLALLNLNRFVLAARSPLAMGSLLERDKTGLPILLVIFSTSQYLSDLLIRDTESYDYLRLTEGQLYSRGIVRDELLAAIDVATEPLQAMQILRRYKHRETLRIAFGDLIVQHKLELVTEQISFLAEAICEAALHFVNKQLVEKWGVPQTSDDERSRFVVFALGKLGGCELNYSSDIDLILVYESDGETTGKKDKANRAFFERLTRDFTKLLTETTSLGAAYRVDLRLRPQGSKGPVCCSKRSFLRYYNLQGRTWERQALIKMRPIAGDIDLGETILQELEPWVYNRTLNRFDIEGIKSLKRQIERRALVDGEQDTNVKTGFGGIRDVEFLIQFLQLLNGGESVRSHNSLTAIRMLAEADCLTIEEARLLTGNYVWLRKLEHRLQIMFDLQTHTLPESNEELAKTAIRMDYRDVGDISALQQFSSDFHQRTNSNNQILNHLLHDAFEVQNVDAKDGDQTEQDDFDAADLILDPEPSESLVQNTLAKYGFASTKSAHQNLLSLARENTIFLSSRRCRHFLAAIARPLLQEIGETPDADATLTSLAGVCDSLGAKGVLWELFSSIPATMKLFVRLCASSDYLCSILKSNPGMIDELVDSLILEKLPSIAWLREHLKDLIGGADDLDPIIHSFKNVFHLRVGIRDILGRDKIRETHRALADIAQVTLETVVQHEFAKSAKKHAKDFDSLEELDSKNSLVILALGKLGGREPNYHSDVDVVFLYAPSETEWLATSDQHFYSDLAGRVTKTVTFQGKYGRLYELDSRLRPTGKSGSLAVSFAEFDRYFTEGDGQLWERQALCKARPVFGSPELCAQATSMVRKSIIGDSWQPKMATDVHDMRLRMQENSHPRNIKRGVGGTVDCEFAVQMLQIKFAESHPEILIPGTLNAISKMKELEILEEDEAELLASSYEFLRGVEARFRLMNIAARHDLPEGKQLQRLAYLLEMDADELDTKVAQTRTRNRELFEQLVAKHS